MSKGINYDVDGVPKNVAKFTGNKYGSLLVVSYSNHVRLKNGKVKYFVLCKCDCGTGTLMELSQIYRSKNPSCGCLPYKAKSQRFTKHGLSTSRIYRIFNAMHNRCYNPKQNGYEIYGGAGIVVCSGWNGIDNFETFVKDMGLPPTGFSIDRIDSTMNYSCGKCSECIKNNWTANCRWTDYGTQARNTRRNKYIILEGVKLTRSEVSRKTGLAESLIKHRIESGWTEHDAISIPVVAGKRTDKRKLYKKW